MDSYIDFVAAHIGNWFVLAIVAFVLFVIVMKSIRTIGPTEVGLVRKRFGSRKLGAGSAIAFNGEAGYQAKLMMPGIQFKIWPLYDVTRHPMVQIPAGQIGVVIAQVGASLPVGAKSGVYKAGFGNFQDLATFVNGGGQKGVQRLVLPPGSVVPIHPVGFLVITKDTVYGVPIDEAYATLERKGGLKPQTFGLTPEQLEVVRIEPRFFEGGKVVDMIGIVTTFEGPPLPKGAIANRIGDFIDLDALEAKPETKDSDLVEAILAVKNEEHNNYQDFQAFLDHGGRIGLQHDPLMYGAYNLNPFLVSVEMVPMLVVNQGEVAVLKAYVGLATEDTSGADFKFGSLVRPGHRGIWQEPLRTGKYAINPRCYSAEIVPTFILTLNWAEASSMAHNLDKSLKQITAKSKEGFVFDIDLQVQIHVPDTEAPKVISIVGTMLNLVTEVLQAAVGNHFRDKLQSMPAIDFIEKRQEVQAQAQAHITEKLKEYRIETRGVYIQDVIFPQQLVSVLTTREIANQQQETYKAEEKAQGQRLDLEQARGKADMQSELARSSIGIDIAKNKAQGVQAEADGKSYRLEKVGRASAVKTEADGLAIAKGLEAQQLAVGKDQTAIINVVRALSAGTQRFMPENLALTLGEGGLGGSLNALVPLIMRRLQKDTTPANDEATAAPVSPSAGSKANRTDSQPTSSKVQHIQATLAEPLHFEKPWTAVVASEPPQGNS